MGIHTAGPALDTAQGRGGALRGGRQGGKAEGERGGRLVHRRVKLRAMLQICRNQQPFSAVPGPPCNLVAAKISK
jgi:hypothetical protein